MSSSKSAGGARQHQSRRLRHLQDLGLIKPREQALVVRAASLRHKKRVSPNAISLSAASLKLLDLPHVEATLFSGEKALRPKLWKHIEWEELPTPPEPPEFSVLGIADVSKVSDPGDDSRGITLAELPAKYRTTARRIMLACQIDDGPITLKHLDEVAGHAALTVDEKEQIPEIKAAVVALAESRPPTMKPILEVPNPETSRIALPHSGSTKLEAVLDLKIVETVTVDTSDPAHPVAYDATLTMDRNISFEVEVAEGEQLLVMDHDRSRVRSDLLIESGTHEIEPRRGATYRMERWKDGERIEASDVRIPEVQATERQNMAP